jgi:hypothetical protein
MKSIGRASDIETVTYGSNILLDMMVLFYLRKNDLLFIIILLELIVLMGDCCSSHSDMSISISSHLAALVITHQTERVIKLLHDKNNQLQINDEINYRGDRLIHYACLKNDEKLVE